MSVRAQLFLQLPVSSFNLNSVLLFRVLNRMSAGYRDHNLVMQSMFKADYASGVSGRATTFLQPFIIYACAVPPD